jgi:hypothetical protein
MGEEGIASVCCLHQLMRNNFFLQKLKPKLLKAGRQGKGVALANNLGPYEDEV